MIRDELWKMKSSTDGTANGKMEGRVVEKRGGQIRMDKQVEAELQ